MSALDWLRLESWVVFALWLVVSMTTVRHFARSGGERPFIKAFLWLCCISLFGSFWEAYYAQRLPSLIPHHDARLSSYIVSACGGASAVVVYWLGEATMYEPRRDWYIPLWLKSALRRGR